VVIKASQRFPPANGLELLAGLGFTLFPGFAEAFGLTVATQVEPLRWLAGVVCFGLAACGSTFRWLPPRPRVVVGALAAVSAVAVGLWQGLSLTDGALLALGSSVVVIASLDVRAAEVELLRGWRGTLVGAGVGGTFFAYFFWRGVLW
jgi:hypothetical protein